MAVRVSETKGLNIAKIQGDHKVFTWLQKFIRRKLRIIQTCRGVEVY